MSETTIEVAEWGDLDLLAAAMAEVGGQMSATTSYAARWVCRADGFVSSPVCVLRPLAEVMELLAEAFTEAGRVWSADWQRLHDATGDAARGLRASDVHADDRFLELTRVA
jgi:hypothetical protein